MYPINRSSRLARTLISSLMLVAFACALTFAGPVEKGEKALAESRFADAAEAFAGILEKDATNRKAALGLAKAATEGTLSDHFAGAIEALLSLREKDPKDLELAVVTGETFLAKARNHGANDPDAMRYALADAKSALGEALALDATSERAAVAAGRTAFEGADFDDGIKILDTFLATKPKEPSRALYWNGRIYYHRALSAYKAGGGGVVSDEVRKKFVKAKAAFEASVLKNPKHFDANMKLAYSSIYLRDKPTAEESYLRAIPLDTTSDLPLKGLNSIYSKKSPEQYTALLTRLAKEHPKHAWVQYYLGYNHLKAKRSNEAIKTFKAYIDCATNKADGWYYMGAAHEQNADSDKAKDAYENALKANPNHPGAAVKLELAVRNEFTPNGGAALDVKGCERALAEYRKLLKLAPKSTFVRNNIALTLRDAYEGHGQSSAFEPMLKESTKLYTEAAEIIGEWDDSMDGVTPWATRYANAQVVSDTGLMYQFYKPTRDYDKAETYYLRALEFSKDGYFDAFNNLCKVYQATEKWEDLYDLCSTCEDSLINANGSEHSQGRGQATAIMKKLLADGKVKDE